ncbi:MAG: DNA starvation/stationary phase protection protein, partial [Hymenobacteraceae bacterium]|nr:DNA starvation/stationary phase protection protein [Hymenobacteraceae bacterium]
LRGFHWNIKGPQFFALHAKFEELYNDAQEKIDMIAERILTLGNTPLHTFSDYIKHSKIAEAHNVSKDTETVSTTVDNLNQILEIEREIAGMAGETGDEGTLGMITEDVTEKEKTIWMLNSFLGK